MQPDAAPMFNSSTRMSAPLVKTIYVESDQEAPTQEKPKAPIGVATMDMHGIVVLELRLVSQSRKAPPVHYWPGMPDYQRVVQHIGITPGQTRFVYPFP
ncbi:MAG TPA: hypothetical protein V6C97_31085 [Oculatellaceae cyanobacterium]